MSSTLLLSQSERGIVFGVPVFHCFFGRDAVSTFHSNQAVRRANELLVGGFVCLTSCVRLE